MATFRETLQGLVNMSEEGKIRCAVESYVSLLPKLREYDEESNGAILFLSIVSTAVAADGTFSAKEKMLVSALFKAQGLEMSDQEMVGLVKNASGQKGYELIQSLSKVLDGESRANLVLFIASICAIDDTISKEEIAYLESLL